MRMFFGVALLALGLVAAPVVAGADPIGPNGCAGEVVVCDIYADYDTAGASELDGLLGNLGGYLVGYTFLLNQAADLADGFQTDDVAHILVIHDSLFQLFSNTVFSTTFSNIFAAAIAGAAIDGTLPGAGQLAGCPPIPDGVPNRRRSRLLHDGRRSQSPRQLGTSLTAHAGADS